MSRPDSLSYKYLCVVFWLNRTEYGNPVLDISATVFTYLAPFLCQEERNIAKRKKERKEKVNKSE